LRKNIVTNQIDLVIDSENLRLNIAIEICVEV